MVKCLCGCGKDIKIIHRHKWTGVPKYIQGHGSRGKKQSKEHIANRLKKTRGKKRSKKFCENLGNIHRGKKMSLQSRIKMSLAKSGKTIFDGFITQNTRLVRATRKYKEWREKVFNRDNYTCQKHNCKFCNNKIGTYLHPHHIKHFSPYPELRFEIDNGVTYCKDYHLKSEIHRGG